MRKVVIGEKEREKRQGKARGWESERGLRSGCFYMKGEDDKNAHVLNPSFDKNADLHKICG